MCVMAFPKKFVHHCHAPGNPP